MNFCVKLNLRDLLDVITIEELLKKVRELVPEGSTVETVDR